MIHIITGAPCSGKSTYVRENKKEGDLVIDFDEIAFCLGSDEKFNAKGIVREASFKARESAIEVALKNPDAESWIVHTSPNEEQLKRYEEAGAEIIALDTDKDECLARAERDGRPQVTFDGIDKYFSEEKGNDMEHKTKSFKLKANENGTISGYFSTYEKTPDSYGDIIEPGAFTKTIEKRKESGHPFPLCWNHDFSSVIGTVDSIEETEKGPYIEASFLDTALAQDVRKMVQSGAVYQFSFAYDVLKAREPNEEEKKSGVMNVLEEVEVFEVSVVTVPANQNAVVTDVKAVDPDVKSGRRNRKSDEEIIRTCINSLKSLLDEGDEDKTEGEEAPKEEDTSKTNEASKESEDAGNSKRASDILAKINQFKEDSI